MCKTKNTLLIKVLKADIKHGEPENSNTCAVARACKRQYKTNNVAVASDGVFIDGVSFEGTKKLDKFVSQFDIDKSKVKPTIFLLHKVKNV